MPLIHLETPINAPLDVVFDLSRSIDLRVHSAADTREKAVGGTVSGLISLGETVTWRAKHFGVQQRLKVEITEMERPRYFTDVMIEGPFRSMRHQHRFEPMEGGTLMRDIFWYEAPYGLIGRVAEWILLTRYMQRFLQQRNKIIKQIAESDDAYRFLNR